jgi:hypothetical protein
VPLGETTAQHATIDTISNSIDEMPRPNRRSCLGFFMIAALDIPEGMQRRACGNVNSLI